MTVTIQVADGYVFALCKGVCSMPKPPKLLHFLSIHEGVTSGVATEDGRWGRTPFNLYYRF